MRPARRLGYFGGAFVLIVTGVVASFPPVALAGGHPSPFAAWQSRLVALEGSYVPLPRGAHPLGLLPRGDRLSLDVVLEPRDPEALNRFALAVSTPGSRLYRHFLARGQFRDRFGPSTASETAVRSWLESKGLSPGPASPNGLVVPVRASAGVVERALGVELAMVRLSSGRLAYAPSRPPEIPSGLAGVVTGIVGLSSVARPHAMAIPGTSRAAEPGSVTPPGRATEPGSEDTHQAASAPGACAADLAVAGQDSAYTTSKLAQAYSFDQLYGEGRMGAGVTVAIYELEPYLASDVAAFQACVGSSASIRNVSVDGGPGSGAGSGEAALDVETVVGLAPRASILVYEGPDTTSQAALDVYNQIAVDDRAQVVTTSWGLCEAELGSGTISAEAEIFQQMAAQGQTVVAAAGDSGSEDCYSPPQSTDGALAVDDPASQPFVTGVGGTSLVSLGPPPQESVWDDSKGAGGGGVSSIWSMPSWQSGPGVVNEYSTGESCGAPSGQLCREVPDVAASADPEHGTVVFYDGAWTVIGGTSAAAPIWAALFALTDSGCFTPGQGPGDVVGFANPALYALGATSDPPFNPVTTGDNQLFSPNPPPPSGYPAGPYFPAGPHYSLADGWGSPIGPLVLQDLQPQGGCPLVTAVSPSSGPVTGGTVVTISGLDLAGVTSVSFGTTAASSVAYDAASGTVEAVVPPGSAASEVSVTVTTLNGTSPAAPGAVFTYEAAPTGSEPPSPPPSNSAPHPGYALVGADGGVFAFGDAGFYGSMAGVHLAAPVVGMASTPDGKGYWLLGADGGVFAFGDAGFYGSMAGVHLAAPVVGGVSTYGVVRR